MNLQRRTRNDRGLLKLNKTQLVSKVGTFYEQYLGINNYNFESLIYPVFFNSTNKN